MRAHEGYSRGDTWGARLVFDVVFTGGNATHQDSEMAASSGVRRQPVRPEAGIVSTCPDHVFREVVDTKANLKHFLSSI